MSSWPDLQSLSINATNSITDTSNTLGNGEYRLLSSGLLNTNRKEAVLLAASRTACQFARQIPPVRKASSHLCISLTGFHLSISSYSQAHFHSLYLTSSPLRITFSLSSGNPPLDQDLKMPHGFLCITACYPGNICVCICTCVCLSILHAGEHWIP